MAMELKANIHTLFLRLWGFHVVSKTHFFTTHVNSETLKTVGNINLTNYRAEITLFKAFTCS